MSRKKEPFTFSIRIDKSLADKIEALAQKHNRTRNQEIEHLLNRGLKNWRKVKFGKTTMEELPYRPHSLRHALNTHLIVAGAPIQYIQMYLGWSATGLTRVQRGYTHSEHVDLRTVSTMIDSIYQYGVNEIPFRKTESS